MRTMLPLGGATQTQHFLRQAHFRVELKPFTIYSSDKPVEDSRSFIEKFARGVFDADGIGDAQNPAPEGWTFAGFNGDMKATYAARWNGGEIPYSVADCACQHEPREAIEHWWCSLNTPLLQSLDPRNIPYM
jgi:hypothetical protein